MKNTFVLFLLLQMQTIAFSQRLLTFCAKCNNYELYKPRCQVFLVNEDTILAKGTSSNDGKVRIPLKTDVPDEEIYVTILLKDGDLGRVNLKRLIDYDTAVRLFDHEIALLSIDSISANSFSIFDDLTYHGKPHPLSCSQESVNRRNGPNSWFFPTDSFVRSSIDDSSFFQNYLFEYGHFPNANEQDTEYQKWIYQQAEEEAGWCSEQLFALNEPIIYNYAAEEVVFRYTWISNRDFYTFDPYTMRIETTADNKMVVYFSYKTVINCDEVVCHDAIPLSEIEFQEFMFLVNSIDFWNLPSRTSCYNGEHDSAYSILEGIMDGTYHVVVRNCSQGDELLNVMRFLWSLTGLGENKIVHRRMRIE